MVGILYFGSKHGVKMTVLLLAIVALYASVDTLRRHGYIEMHTPSVVARLKRFSSPVKPGRAKFRMG
ncbi:MAG: hypothetical protein ACLUDU_11735 [Butyricimonas faecihominis]